MNILTSKVMASGFNLPVSPRWQNGKLYLSDMGADRVLTIDAHGRVQELFTVKDGWPNGLGFLPGGRLLCVVYKRKQILSFSSTGLTLYKDLTAVPVKAINDMIVDGHGRAYIGSRMAVEVWPRPATPEDHILLLYPDGTVKVAAEKMHHPNGMAITKDGKTFIVAETISHRLTAFDIAKDGTLSNRRTYANLGDIEPDGIALDSEGGVWIAAPFSHQTLRVKEGGQVTHNVPMPKGKRVFACTLGGPDRKTLYFTCGFAGTPRETSTNPRQGFVEYLPVDVPGIGWP